jgi:hypothetical protein
MEIPKCSEKKTISIYDNTFWNFFEIKTFSSNNFQTKKEGFKIINLHHNSQQLKFLRHS